MATNPIFDGGRGESVEMDILEDNIIEEIQISGTDILYIPREWVSTDDMLFEVTASSFRKAYEIEAKIEGLDSMVKNAWMLTNLNFGIPLTNINVTVSKRRFRECVPDEALAAPGRPNEGDLVFIPISKTLLEIKSADPDNLLSSGGRLHVYKLQCEFYRHSAEALPTDPADGITDIDQIPEIILKDYIDIVVDEENDMRDIDSGRTGNNEIIDNEPDGIVPERK